MINVEIIKSYIDFSDASEVLEDSSIIKCETILDPSSFEVIHFVQFYKNGIISEITIYEEDILDWIKEKRFEKINNILND
jgi:hypothetical protein